MIGRDLVEKRTQLILNSKMRRLDLYPNTWSYCVNLPERLKSVVSFSLVQCILPNTQAVVNQFNQYLQFVKLLTAELITISIPINNYEPGLLMQQVQDQLAPFLVNATVTLNDDSRVTIAAEEPFSLLFSTGDKAMNSISRVLGFAPADSEFDLTSTGKFKIDLPPPAYCTIAVREIPSLACKRFITTTHEESPQYNSRPEQYGRDVLGLVPLDNQYGTNKFYHADVGDTLCNRFQPMELSQLTVEVYDDKGQYYDSNGYDHTLVFEVVTKEAPWCA